MKVSERSRRKLTHPCSHQQPLRVYLLHFHPAPLHHLIHRHLATVQEPYFNIVFTSTTSVFPFIWRLQINGWLFSLILCRGLSAKNFGASINHLSVVHVSVITLSL